MSKKKKYIILSILITFSIYCSLTIGQSLDEHYHLLQGKITLDYLFSLGQINKDMPYGDFYSTIYWSFLYLITELFPSKYETSVGHLVNLFFSFATIFGIGKITSVLFNKKVGSIVFIVLFFYPAFFGHMSINNKDTILAFCHVWMIYLILRYIQKQNIKKKANQYVIYLGLLAALATGIQLTFLGSQIPIIFFILIEIFYMKKIICKNFSIKVFFFDLAKCFLIFYSVLLIFWKNAHENIITYPFQAVQKWMSSDLITGWPYTLVNGDYYLSVDAPASYFLINFIYKSPEYLLLSYLVFLILIITSLSFFKKKINFFNYKLYLIFFILAFPNLIMLIIPFPVNDGLRLFLWTLPYFCIIPGLTIYYFIENFTYVKQKIVLSSFLILFIYFLTNFILLTPYQYTYLNSLNGEVKNRYQKFENDYWATSIEELVKNANFKTDEILKFTTCGFITTSPKQYLKKRPEIKYRFVPYKEAEYIFMTNRVSRFHGVMNCFDLFKGEDIATVERNGMILSVIRKIKI